jgi:hypothetical protein
MSIRTGSSFRRSVLYAIYYKHSHIPRRRHGLNLRLNGTNLWNRLDRSNVRTRIDKLFHGHTWIRHNWLDRNLLGHVWRQRLRRNFVFSTFHDKL